MGLVHGHLCPFGVRFLLHKSGALNNSESGSSSFRKAPNFRDVPGQAAMWKQVLSWAGKQDFYKVLGLWSCREEPSSFSGTSAGSRAASCLPSWDLFPLLVTEGSWTQAQPKHSCGGEAAQLCLRRRRKILIKHSNLDLQPTNTWEMQPTPVWGHLLE